MTKPRIDKLDSLGFDFTPRKQESGLKITIFPPEYDHGGGGAGRYTGNFGNVMEWTKNGFQSCQQSSSFFAACPSSHASLFLCTTEPHQGPHYSAVV
jgi:hypothetical protein